MSDPQLPPPDPDDVERDEESAPDEHRDPAERPAVAGMGPALLAPPLPSTDPDPDEDDRDDDGDEDRPDEAGARDDT